MIQPPRLGDQPTTRGRILRAAAETIAEKGWGGVRTRRVAERAGVNNALVQYHFGSRSALLFEAAAAALVTELQVPTEALFHAGTLGEGFEAVLRWLGQLDKRSPSVSVLAEVLVQATRDEEIRRLAHAALEGFRAGVEDLVKAGRAVGELPPHTDSRGLAIFLTAALDGLLLHRLVDPGTDLQSAGRALETLLGSPGTGRGAR